MWPEVAQNFVGACGTLTEARSVLAELEQSGLSMEELKQKVEQCFSKHLDEKRTKFISPTNGEMAMTFVVDCGGYEQAKACLDIYADGIDGNIGDGQ